MLYRLTTLVSPIPCHGLNDLTKKGLHPWVGVRVLGPYLPNTNDPKPFMASQALKVTKFNSKLSNLWRKKVTYGGAGKYEKYIQIFKKML